MDMVGITVGIGPAVMAVGQWMVPTIVGGAIVYEVARQQPVYVQQPVIVQQQPVVVESQNQSCSPWTETQNPDGTVTRTRTCTK